MPERFSASVAGRHMACHASAQLELAIPNWTPPVVDPNKGAKGVGTARHQMLEPIMELSARDIQHMADVLTYVAKLRALRRFKVLVEEPVQATWLPSPSGTTADLVLYTQDELHIIDFKWGKIFVDAVDNEQLLFYAACYSQLAPKASGATLHIVQPYADNYTPWFVSATEIRRFMDEAIAAQVAIVKGSVSFGPSDHCKFCPANPHGRGDKGRPLCPAMMQILYPTVVDESDILSL